MHKAGFVNIIGSPNVGKSTLMNAMVGEKLSIITSKAQTTRHRIMGIVNGDDYQIVYSDTPGILKSHYLLHDAMMKFVSTALVDADILLYVTDIFEVDIDEKIHRILTEAKVPLICILNKIDLATQEKLEEKMIFWKEKLPNAYVIPASAITKFNAEHLFNKIIEALPTGEPYFSKDVLTDKPQRFFSSEIIREKIFVHYKKEIPYSCEVVIEEYKEEPTIDRIRAIINVERDSQKSILIGKGGLALKRVGTEARIEMESFIGKKIFLEIVVKVEKDWRKNERSLRNYGYYQS